MHNESTHQTIPAAPVAPRSDDRRFDIPIPTDGEIVLTDEDGTALCVRPSIPQTRRRRLFDGRPPRIGARLVPLAGITFMTSRHDPMVSAGAFAPVHEVIAVTSVTQDREGRHSSLIGAWKIRVAEDGLTLEVGGRDGFVFLKRIATGRMEENWHRDRLALEVAYDLEAARSAVAHAKARLEGLHDNDAPRSRAQRRVEREVGQVEDDLRSDGPVFPELYYSFGHGQENALRARCPKAALLDCAFAQAAAGKSWEMAHWSVDGKIMRTFLALHDYDRQVAGEALLKALGEDAEPFLARIFDGALEPHGVGCALPAVLTSPEDRVRGNPVLHVEPLKGLTIYNHEGYLTRRLGPHARGYVPCRFRIAVWPLAGGIAGPESLIGTQAGVRYDFYDTPDDSRTIAMPIKAPAASAVPEPDVLPFPAAAPTGEPDTAA